MNRTPPRDVFPFPRTFSGIRHLISSTAGILAIFLIVGGSGAIPRLAAAATTDCIEDGGMRICSRPSLSSWVYGYCIGNSLSTTIAAANYCATLTPHPWTSQSQIIQFTECLPEAQFGACSAQANFTGWASPGSSDSSLVPQCSTQTVTVDT